MVAKVSYSTASPSKEGAPITTTLVWIMAIANCVIISNIYYNQPLLIKMEVYFNVSKQAIRWVPIVTQGGYALGLLFAAPLGDMFERKRVIIVSSLLATLFLACVALSPNFPLLLTSSLFLGIFSTVPQMLVPFAANLAKPEERGKTVGMVMSGLLIGVLLSRTFAGYMGDHFGWKSIFWAALCLSLIISGLLFKLLPINLPNYKGTYKDLFLSLYKLSAEFAELRAAAYIGALLFGAFFMFWPVAIFILSTPPYHYGASEVGLLALLGAGGAFMAPFFGLFSDQIGPYKIIIIGILIEIIAFFILLFWGLHLAGLIVFVVLVDLAQQMCHIANQTRIFALQPEARSRLNTVYMFAAFVGAAMGSALGSFAWEKGHLTGICIGGFILPLVALCIHFFHSKKNSEKIA